MPTAGVLLGEFFLYHFTGKLQEVEKVETDAMLIPVLEKNHNNSFKFLQHNDTFNQ